MGSVRFKKTNIRFRGLRLGLLGTTLLASGGSYASDQLFSLSLEELLALEVTSVSKGAQSISEVAAAIHVITREDIARSGMTSIPDLLRMVPGLHVANIDGNKWSVSARGFGGRWSNKLLVLMDGRTLYTPLFSGVYWDVQNTLLEDVERIEVVRGSGGTIWGSNAVNGVINIITRHTRDTQGGLVVARAGDQERGLSLRYGAELPGDGWFRVYAKADDYDRFTDGYSGLQPAHDAHDMQQAGFRADWNSANGDEFTLQGDVYRGNAEQTTAWQESLMSFPDYRQDKAELNGANLMLNWKRTLADGSQWQLNTYFDRAEREELVLKQRIDTFDLDMQHRFRASDRQEITWGLGFRRLSENIEGTHTVSFEPGSLRQNLWSAFLQDEIQLQDDLRLIVGSKFEHNDYSGFEYQPNARLLWQASEDHTLWGAVSRAVRTPSRSDRDMFINVWGIPFTYQFSVSGNDDWRSESATSFELGYRGQPHSDFSLDVTAFYSQYHHLTSNEIISTDITVLNPFPYTYEHEISLLENRMSGESYGVELGATWQVNPDWRLMLGYSWHQFAMHLDEGSTDNGDSELDREQGTPQQQLQLRSKWDIRHDLQLDAGLYLVDGIDVRDTSPFRRHVPGYARLDLRLGWMPRKDLEFSLIGQNLLDDSHPEYYSADGYSSEVPRAVFGQVKVLFE